MSGDYFAAKMDDMHERDHQREATDAASVKSDVHPFIKWLDKNCDHKSHHAGKVPMDNGKFYEGDNWHFVIEDHEDGETPAIVVTVGCEPESDYMDVRIENRDEMGDLEAQVGIGLFDEIESLETLLRVLVKENR